MVSICGLLSTVYSTWAAERLRACPQPGRHCTLGHAADSTSTGDSFGLFYASTKHSYSGASGGATSGSSRDAARGHGGGSLLLVAGKEQPQSHAVSGAGKRIH